MKNPGKNFIEALKASLSNIVKLGKDLDERMKEAAKDQPDCDHGVVFDEEAAKKMTAIEIKRIYPRLCGECPKGCGYNGIAYASAMHYYSGDW
jgi:hypothetical protein